MKKIVNFLTSKQASKYLQIPLRTIQHLTKQGKIKAIRIGNNWKYAEEDIKGYLCLGTDFSKEPIRKTEGFIERRTFPRINCALPCYIKVIIPKKKEIHTQGIILNIGEGGVFLEKSSLDIRNDDPIDLEFELDGRGRLNTNGRVLRTQDNKLAVKFRDISGEAREMICGYVG